MALQLPFFLLQATVFQNVLARNLKQEYSSTHIKGHCSGTEEAAEYQHEEEPSDCQQQQKMCVQK